MRIYFHRHAYHTRLFQQIIIYVATNGIPWKRSWSFGWKWLLSSAPLKSKLMSMYLPNLLLLSFLLVCAFPNDSRMSFDWNKGMWDQCILVLPKLLIPKFSLNQKSAPEEAHPSPSQFLPAEPHWWSEEKKGGQNFPWIWCLIFRCASISRT